MAQGDGSVVITVKVDTGNAEKEIAKLKREIDTLEKQLAKLGESKTPLEAQFTELGAQLDAAKAKLAALQEQAQRQFPPEGEGAGDPSQYVEGFTPKGELDAQIKEAQKEVDALQKKYDGVGDKIDAINTKMQQTQGEIDAAKTSAGELEAKLVEAGQATDASLNAALDRAKKKTNEVSKRVAGLIKRVLFYSVVTIVFRHLREWMGKVLEATDETSEAMKRLKAAALTAAQPIINVLTPAITALLNALTKLVSYIATVISVLFGSTFDESKKSAEALKDETDALNGVGGAAKKAGKSLASFDEINKLNGDTSGGGGGGATSDADFAGIVGVELGKISALVGASLLAIGAILAFNGYPVIGIALMAAGAAVLAATVKQSAGEDWGNLLGKVLALAVLASALGLAFGKTAAGIGLVVGGLALLADAVVDIINNGLTLENTLEIIAGLFAAGLGISLLTGSWIPLLVAGIAGISLLFAELTGNGDELIEHLTEIFTGFKDFFAGIFTGDIDLAAEGLKSIFSGILGAADTILKSIKDLLTSFLDWLEENASMYFLPIIGLVRNVIESVYETVHNVIEHIKEILFALIDFITGVFTGDWDKAWEGVKGIFRGFCNIIIDLVEGAVNLVVSGAEGLVNGFVGLLNNLPGVNLERVSWNGLSLPRLAQGAVIPPNREFLAVLGDQKRGTNIEAPLETIVQAFRQAMSEMGATGGRGKQTIVLEVDKREFGRITFDAYNAESQRVGVSLGGA